MHRMIGSQVMKSLVADGKTWKWFCPSLYVPGVVHLETSNNITQSINKLVWYITLVTVFNTSQDDRGSMNNKAYIWPPMWQKSSENPNPPSISMLELKEAKTTSRAMILNFGILHFQVSYIRAMLLNLLIFFQNIDWNWNIWHDNLPLC